MSDTPIGTNFRNNRFVLTGDAEGDYGVTLSMISNACNAASNYLLSKPSTVPHPTTRATPQTTAVLPIGSANYNTIASWIATGCPDTDDRIAKDHPFDRVAGNPGCMRRLIEPPREPSRR